MGCIRNGEDVSEPASMEEEAPTKRKEVSKCAQAQTMQELKSVVFAMGNLGFAPGKKVSRRVAPKDKDKG